MLRQLTMQRRGQTDRIARRFAQWLTDGRLWQAKAILTVVAVTLFFSFPSYEVIVQGTHREAWIPVLRQVEQPFRDMTKDYGPETHASKLTFRMTVPLIASALGIGQLGLIILQGLAGVAMLWMAMDLCYRITADKIVSVLFALGLGGIYAGAMAFVELRGIFDGVAVCLLVAALWFRHPAGVLAATFLAAWTDERALVAAGVVLVFHLVSAERARAGAVVAGVCAYVVTRWSVTVAFDLSTPTEGAGIALLINQINMIPMGLWTAFEGLWAPILLGLAVLYADRQYLLATLFAGSLTLVLLVGFMVFDITRSLAYGVPALFIAVHVLQSSRFRARLPQVIGWSALVSVVGATYSAGGSRTIYWVFPLPLQILRWVMML